MPRRIDAFVHSSKVVIIPESHSTTDAGLSRMMPCSLTLLGQLQVCQVTKKARAPRSLQATYENWQKFHALCLPLLSELILRQFSSKKCWKQSLQTTSRLHAKFENGRMLSLQGDKHLERN